jgi:DNA-binding PadR family transcriptional regulator
MERGNFKYLLLDALKDKPMHGYEIMMVTNEKYGGFYTPSPGLVYPTLQLLEDEGHATSKTENGKKIYTITDEGMKLLAEKKLVLEEVFQRRQKFFKGPRGDLIREGRRLARLLWSHRELSDDKAKEISRILADTSNKIEVILSQ